MTIKSGTGQACAACKYQRRRCTPECLLAPFFPADQPKVFQNVHRLFGVKHIQNLLKELDPEKKAMAVHSIKFHAHMRDQFPVHGCLVEIHHLTCQLQYAQQEFNSLMQQLDYYRQQSQQPLLQLGMTTPDNNNNNNNNNNNPPLALGGAEQTSYSDNGHGDCNNENSPVILDSMWAPQTYSYNNIDQHAKAVVQPQMTPSEPLSNQDYSDMHHFFDAIDDRHSYIGSKESYESSLQSSLRDSRHTVEQIGENELKSAAACFTLTSVN